MSEKDASSAPEAGSVKEEAKMEETVFSKFLEGEGCTRGAMPLVTVPCILAPAAILGSPGFSTGQFALTHQAVLATVTAQAQMQLHSSFPSSSETNSFPQATPLTPTLSQQLEQRPSEASEKKDTTINKKLQPKRTVTKTSCDDGYNWRKYGQKQVKNSDRSRSYYKCTDTNCVAKKKVERCPKGREMEIMFRGQHNHDPPQKTKIPKEKVAPAPSGENGNLDILSSEVNEDNSTSKKGKSYSNETPERQLYCSSDCEGDAAIKTEEEHGDEPDHKRRLCENTTPYSAPILKTFKEPKVIVQSANDAACTSDGYRWRKYGQKLVKGNPNPRSYYRCTYNGCPVRKHVEKSSDNSESVLISYDGKHNHDKPSITTISALNKTNDEHIHTSEIPISENTSVDGEEPRDKASELGGKKALESAETLLSIGLNSSSGKESIGTNSDGIINHPMFANEKCAAVPVQNS